MIMMMMIMMSNILVVMMAIANVNEMLRFCLAEASWAGLAWAGALGLLLELKPKLDAMRARSQELWLWHCVANLNE